MTATRGGARRPPRAPAEDAATARAGAGAPARKGGGDVQGSGRLAALLLSPTLLVLALVIGYPVLAALRESLYARGEGLDAEGFVVRGRKFVGLGNYTAIFTGATGRRVLERLRQHHVLHRHHRGTRDRARRRDGADHAPGVPRPGASCARASWCPWAIPTAVSGLLWRWIFQADGVANAMIGRQILWTAEGFPAKIAVIIAEIVEDLAVHRPAGARGPPDDPRATSTRRRGSTAPAAWQQFWRITLPLVKPALLVAVLFRMLDVLRMFDLPVVLIGVTRTPWRPSR